MHTPLRKFLSGEGKDHLGRSIEEILNQDDHWLEFTHNWIQWCFPLFEPSQSVKNLPTLDSIEEVELIRGCSVSQENMRRALMRYAEFLRDSDQWLRYHDHNHLRITRVIKSAKLLMSEEQAAEFFTYVMGQVEGRAKGKLSKISLNYWEQELDVGDNQPNSSME